MRIAPALTLTLCCIVAVAGAQPTDVQAEMRALLDKAIKAHGGTAKLDKLQAASWKGQATFAINGQQAVLKHEGTAQGVDQYRFDLELQINGQLVNLVAAIDKDKAWIQANGQKANDIPAKDLGAALHFLYALRVCHMLPAFKTTDYTLSPLGEIKVADRDAVGVTVARKGWPDARLFFDKQNGLLVRSELGFMSAQGKELGLECNFSDFKAFAGLKHATRVALKLDGQVITLEFSEVRPQDQVDRSVFAKP